MNAVHVYIAGTKVQICTTWNSIQVHGSQRCQLPNMLNRKGGHDSPPSDAATSHSAFGLAFVATHLHNKSFLSTKLQNNWTGKYLA